jgi:hypothetical protein
MELHQTKKLLHSKGKVTRLKRQPTECKKIFAIYTSDKGLITHKIKGAQNINLAKNQQPIE